MTEVDYEASPDEIVAKLNRETSKISWTELLPFFAKGMAIYVSHTLDLIKVAYELSQDNKAQMQQWMNDGLVTNVSDEGEQSLVVLINVIASVQLFHYVQNSGCGVTH